MWMAALNDIHDWDRFFGVGFLVIVVFFFELIGGD